MDYQDYYNYDNPYDQPAASAPPPPAAPQYTIGNGPNAANPAAPMPGYDDAHDPYQGSWQINDATGGWYWLPKGSSTTHQGDVIAPKPRTGENINPGVTAPSPGTPGTLTDPAYYSPFVGAAPTFTYKQFVAPPPFVAPDPFKAPTPEEAENDPGYKFVRDQGDQAFMQSAAAQGLSRSAGTAKGLSDYNRGAAATQYGNVYARDYGRYSDNYARAFGQYQSLFNNSLAADAQEFSHADNAYRDAMTEFLANRDTFYSNQGNPFGKLLSLAQLGASTNT